MNKAASNRLISKQESVVLLGQLDLVTCSETIESVSISNSKRLSFENDTTDISFLQKYIERPLTQESLCLQEFFNYLKNILNPGNKIIIPHFVGINGSPVFPVNDNYAKQSLIVYKPWRIYPTSTDWKKEFEYFVHLPSTPVSCKLPYHRVMQRWYDKMAGYEPVTGIHDYSSNPIPDDIKVLLSLTGMSGNDIQDFDDAMLKKLDRGFDYDWDRDPIVSFSPVSIFHVTRNYENCKSKFLFRNRNEK
jgi:hypothetical protein